MKNLVLIKSPRINDVLVKYIRLEHLESFLSGELFMNSVFNYEDYFEAISPIHLHIHHIKKVTVEKFLDRANKDFSPDWSAPELYKEFQQSQLLDKQKKSLQRILNHEENEKKLTIDEVEEYFYYMMAHEHRSEYYHHNYQLGSYVSCWFRSTNENHESYLMWRQYGSEDSVAALIRYRTFKQIIKSIDSNIEQQMQDVANLKKKTSEL